MKELQTASNNGQTQWGTQLTNKTTKYMDETAPEYYRLVAGYYALHDGPYLLGDRVTYADFVIYQSLHNDIKTGTLPVSYSLAGSSPAGRVLLY